MLLEQEPQQQEKNIINKDNLKNHLLLVQDIIRVVLEQQVLEHKEQNPTVTKQATTIHTTTTNKGK